MAEEYKLPYSGADIYRRLRDVDSKAKVMTMTTDEYNALGETDANTLYLMTDSEEEVLITVEDIDAICGDLSLDVNMTLTNFSVTDDGQGNVTING